MPSKLTVIRGGKKNLSFDQYSAIAQRLCETGRAITEPGICPACGRRKTPTNCCAENASWSNCRWLRQSLLA